MSETREKARALLAAADSWPWRVSVNRDGFIIADRNSFRVAEFRRLSPMGSALAGAIGADVDDAKDAAELAVFAVNNLATLIAEADASERRAVEAEAGAAAMRAVVQRASVLGGLRDEAVSALATDAGRAILAERDALRAENAELHHAAAALRNVAESRAVELQHALDHYEPACEHDVMPGVDRRPIIRKCLDDTNAALAANAGREYHDAAETAKIRADTFLAELQRMSARKAAFCGCADDGEGNEPYRDTSCVDCGGSGAVIVEGE